MYDQYANLWAQVLRGVRPEVPSFIDDRYTKLLVQCWSDDPDQRPSISTVVNALQEYWEGSIHRYIFSTQFIVDSQQIMDFYNSENKRLEYQLRLTNKSFSSFGAGSRGSIGGVGPTARCVLVFVLYCVKRLIWLLQINFVSRRRDCPSSS
jgi:hypothetical protein